MVWCGYDKDMEVGVRQFGSGLANALRARSAEDGVPLDHIPELELTELAAFADELKRSPRGPRTKALEGLTIFVQGLIETADNMSKASNVSFDAALQREVEVIASLIKPLEDKFQEYSPKSDRSGARVTGMQKLALWLARQ